MNRVFDDFFRGFDVPVSIFGGALSWPRVDIAETDKEYRVAAELAGLEEGNSSSRCMTML
jgi:HSP20 family protein